MPIVTGGIDRRDPFPRAEDVALPRGPPRSNARSSASLTNIRDSLLRYVLSFGLSVQDGEEIIQEVFLALFRHLRAGKSRRNLPGWIFSVAHNLALKRRHENQRLQNEIDSEGKLVKSQVDPSPNPEALGTVRQRQSDCWLQFVPSRSKIKAVCDCALKVSVIGKSPAILGISLGSVARSLARSLARLMSPR